MLLKASICAVLSGLGTASGEPASGEPREDARHWRELGRAALAERLGEPRTERRAANVILFLGDGMGVSTVTAARILDGQLRGAPGEEGALSFEELPHTALAKTYNTDQQVPDSAGTMTAIMCGVKTSAGVLGVGPDVPRGDFEAAGESSCETLLEWCKARGMRVGVVTTARLTHATPAACYAHSPERSWECDADVPAPAREAGFPDLALQLVASAAAGGIDLAWGGGRAKFLPAAAEDPEYAGRTGERLEGDLVAQWLSVEGAAYVWDRRGFEELAPPLRGPLLGLFEPSHMQFEHDRRRADEPGEPSLTEMTVKAIELLDEGAGGAGFFLVVEAGRIDHAHHAANAYRALTETIELGRAVAAARELTDPSETLIVVTADHSHVFTFGGYPTRGNAILGKVHTSRPGSGATAELARDRDGRPYTTLAYGNGPGHGQPDLTRVDTTGPDYRQECAVPLGSETHAGEDVPVYAGGPWSHLVAGVMEQHVLYYVLRHALEEEEEESGR